MMEARIPFSGFYDSVWSKGVDDEEAQYAEQLAEEHQLPQDKIQELLFRHTTYSWAYKHIAAEYALGFQKTINSELKLNVFMAYKEMSSPKYYNFETDALYIDISYKDALILARRVGRDALRATAKSMFTSRDGFISFYDADISTWGQLRTWDHNQLYALMQAAMSAVEVEDFDWSIYEDMSGNGNFSNAYSKAVDYNVVMLEIGKLVGAKELAEESIEGDDGKRYPVAWHNTADYVQRYNDMNLNPYSNELKGKL